jgi:hypothetical protein
MEIEDEVARIFRERFDALFYDTDAARRILSSAMGHRDIFARMSEEWGVYLDGLEEHGVRRVGRLAHMVIGSSGDEVAVDDPLADSSLILVPRDFAFRMVVMGGLP